MSDAFVTEMDEPSHTLAWVALPPRIVGLCVKNNMSGSQWGGARGRRLIKRV